MKVFCLTLLALFPLALMANDDLEKTYAALYELSVSTSESTVGQRGAAKLIEKRNLSFAKVKSERSLQFLFQPFLNLETFFSPAMLQGLARATATPLENPEVVNKELARLKLWLALRPGKMKFHELNAADQAELLQSLLQSKLSVLRRIAKNVRALQLDAAYGAELGFVFSGTPFPKIVNPTPVPKPTFKTHLKYNSATQEMEGALDYIVVGSGASGSIIAAELHRAGKRWLS